ncbi:MAG: hypothetical protein F9K16_02930 [Thermoanaerobaculia bacterium]|nr:MAG: hypothetical protein F9K16_02930 [Thermoanaerobaculia bacterium]MBZ0102130.1 hypothetical protein [Thermoanaerobaculia bacterium]
MSRSNYRFYIPWMTAVLRLTAARHGRKDGRVGIPRPARAGRDGRAARASHFEMRIKQKIDKDTRGLATAWSETDAELLASYCEAVERRRRSDARLVELGGRLATLRASAEALAKEWRSQLDEIRIPSWLHWTLVLGLGVGEIPLNAVAFRVLGESNLQTLLFSSTLAIGLPLLAEGAGVFLRRTGLNKSRPLAERALLIVLLLVALGLIGGIIESPSLQLTSRQAA